MLSNRNMYYKWTLLLSLSLIVILQSCTPSDDQFRTDLEQNFLNPPNSSKPRVWWHWMNGNVTKDGIKKDLEWMHRNGIGGFQNFDAGMTTPQIVENRLVYMTPEWKEAFAFATNLADSLNLEMAIAGSPGWSQTGGPWVEIKDGMKKLVWNEIRIEGGRIFEGVVPAPKATTGTFLNIPLQDELSAFSGGHNKAPEYYDDIAVIAWKLPKNDVDLADLNPKVTSSGGKFNLKQLTDGDLGTTNLLPVAKKEDYVWIQFEFGQSQTVKSISLVGGGTREQWGSLPPANTRKLQVSDNGVDFREICSLPLGGVDRQTISFPETTAKYFRILFQNPANTPNSGIAAMFGRVPEIKGIDIAEIILHPVTRINHSEEKAGFAAEFDLEEYPTPETTDFIEAKNIVDLTSKLKEDGTLEWDAPEGNWKIVRFGYSLTGKENHPASPEATGLEVDKLDARAVKDYFENYLGQYKDATGGLMGEKGLQYIITDSYEAGNMTWTPAMAQEFEKRRGYSVIPWLPVLTGEIIESTGASEQFLWDWRKTISELIAENHYDQLTTILQQYGMKRYTEAHENGRLYIVDGMDVKRKAAVPMSAMWVPNGGGGSALPMAQADIRESASVAHIYGQNLVAAESLTAAGLNQNAWSYCPENLKPTADLELANGLNRFVIHTSVHQPVDDKIPGLGLMIFGQWFNRHETWAEQAKAWTDYLARSSYMLQQGKFVADVVYYYGEDNNITGLFGHQLPDIPKGYNFDFINPDALINLLAVEDHKLVTPSGMSYQILALDKNTKRMSLPVLRKLAQLADNGAIIVGSRPKYKAGLQGDVDEFNRLVDEIWKSGKENIHETESIQQVLTSLDLKPDFSYSSGNNTELLNVHRKLGDIDIYWVNNRSDQSESVQGTFRVEGKKPEIWQPETGEISEVSYLMKNGETTVSLNLKPNDAVFVVFAQPTNKSKLELPVVQERELFTVEGPWNVSFQPERGAPAKATFAKLESFSENKDEGIKYFSGTATYTNTFQISETDLSEGELYLDLGAVQNLAEVTLNGKNLGVIWKKPFRLRLKEAVQPGKNELEIKVVNLWVNRLIGDAQPDVSEKITYTTMPFYQANSHLLPSGLLGPVQLVRTL